MISPMTWMTQTQRTNSTSHCSSENTNWWSTLAMACFTDTNIAAHHQVCCWLQASQHYHLPLQDDSHLCYNGRGLWWWSDCSWCPVGNLCFVCELEPLNSEYYLCFIWDITVISMLRSERGVVADWNSVGWDSRQPLLLLRPVTVNGTHNTTRCYPETEWSIKSISTSCRQSLS